MSRLPYYNNVKIVKHTDTTCKSQEKSSTIYSITEFKEKVKDADVNGLIHEIHLKLNHPSSKTAYNTIKNFYYVPNIEKRFKQYAKNCKFCQDYKRKKTIMD